MTRKSNFRGKSDLIDCQEQPQRDAKPIGVRNHADKSDPTVADPCLSPKQHRLLQKLVVPRSSVANHVQSREITTVDCRFRQSNPRSWETSLRCQTMPSDVRNRACRIENLHQVDKNQRRSKHPCTAPPR